MGSAFGLRGSAAGRLFQHGVAHARVAVVAVQQQQPRKVAELADRKVGGEDRLTTTKERGCQDHGRRAVLCVCACVRVYACLGVRALRGHGSDLRACERESVCVRVMSTVSVAPAAPPAR